MIGFTSATVVALSNMYREVKPKRSIQYLSIRFHFLYHWLCEIEVGESGCFRPGLSNARPAMLSSVARVEIKAVKKLHGGKSFDAITKLHRNYFGVISANTIVLRLVYSQCVNSTRRVSI